ncbi:CG7101 [Drosophila busckii]|uniref:CG7101 n=1 Tax=Drosophila busckii TaxID=30019 RepID=A0A0M4F956_DROBS|nr:zinc finger protein 317 [Drosophila busckii]ALC48682.1 CG7101 [Drosophila busckii]
MEPKFILPKPATVRSDNKSELADSTATRQRAARHYYCHHCLVAFPRYLKCKTHQKLCDARLTNLHICRYCLTLYGSEQPLQRHMQRKHTDRMFMCLQCGTAGRRYKSSIYLHKHVVTWHGTQSLFYCAMCAHNWSDAKAFSSLDQLVAHAEHVHQLIGDDRTSSFDETEDLEMLEENIDDLLPIGDWDDDLTFGWPMDLEKMSCIADPLPKPSGYVCPICANGFTGSLGLIRHIEVTHQRNPLDCIFCGKTHKNRESVRAHLQRQHVLLRAHACKLCQAEFTTSDHLRKHMDSQHLERRHLCPQCGKAFGQKVHLTAHMCSERGHCSYICNICHAQYFRSIDLNRHIKLQHDDTEEQTENDLEKFENTLLNIS